MQKEDTLISQDDLYVHTRDTSFGTSPIDADLESCNQQKDTIEYEPTHQPELYRSPVHDPFENSAGIPAEQTAANDEDAQIIGKISSGKESHEPIPETSRNPENSQVIPSQNSPETPENNPEIDAQEAEEIANTRSEKYILGPNPNPNNSDSYRY